MGYWPFRPLFILLLMTWKNGGVSVRRGLLWVAYLVRFTILEPVRLLEYFLFDTAIRAHQLSAPPVFILGHWRSGTSYLQTLLFVDPQHTTSTIFRSLFSDVFYLSERWLKPLLGLLSRVLGVRYSIQRSVMDFDLPAEGDLGICCLSSPYSYTWGHVFPRRFGQWMQEMVYAPTDEAAAGWSAAYDYFIRKLSLGAQGKRVVLKSPGDTARLSGLLRLFPEAKFVYIHRSPEDVFHSNRYLWRVILKDHGLQTLGPEAVDSYILEHYAAVQSRYRAQRGEIPPRQLVEIDYAALRRDPIATLSKVYAQLDLGEVPIQALKQFQQQQSAYQGQTYDTSPELAERLRQAWGLTSVS